MTRDQAVNCLAKLPVDTVGRPYNSPEWLVSSLLSLGVLRLDEPKDAQDEFLDDLYAAGSPTVPLTYNNLRQKLIDAGCKIVKK